MDDYLVQASGLKKSFGSVHAVNGVDLNVVPGEIYGLVGSDGAGKTTTMRLLVGALRPDDGEINICGYDVLRQTESARSAIGYLSQRFSMYEDLTVLENIRFFAELRGLTSKEWLPRSMEILEFVKEQEVDPVYYESSYYMAPEEAGEKPYALLFESLKR
ncbi:MAG: ATP-binding cassette domain-containing protein, partial [Chloroflexi bacterium]|nr:ATP-binding cassette domain-containing protein [Chloroflexota bacterium]